MQNVSASICAIAPVSHWFPAQRVGSVPAQPATSASASPPRAEFYVKLLTGSTAR